MCIEKLKFSSILMLKSCTTFSGLIIQPSSMTGDSTLQLKNITYICYTYNRPTHLNITTQQVLTGASSQTCQLQLGCVCKLQLINCHNSQVLTGVAPDAERVDFWNSNKRLNGYLVTFQLLSGFIFFWIHLLLYILYSLFRCMPCIL